jgi:ribosome maturation protein Sdo1
LSAVTGPQQEILKACRNVFPKWISREEVAVKLEKTVSGSFLNDLSKLHTAVMIEYGNNEWKQHVRLAAWTILASAVTV